MDIEINILAGLANQIEAFKDIQNKAIQANYLDTALEAGQCIFDCYILIAEIQFKTFGL